MEDLPNEVMVMILNFLPVSEIFALMRTSRSFQQSCESAIPFRHRLQLGEKDKWKELEWTSVSKLDTIDWDRIQSKHYSEFSKCMAKMRNIRILRVDMSDAVTFERRFRRKLTAAVVQQNSSTLMQLCLDDGLCLPGLPDPAATYVNLMRLSCAVLQDDDIALCPSLVEIAADDMPTTALQSLNPHRILSIDIEIWSPDLSSFSHLINLTCLHLELVDEVTENDNVVRDNEIGQVCSWFPKLQTLKLYLRWGRMSDASLCHVSQLRHLKKLTIYALNQDITTDGVRSILHGGSRSSLTEFKIYSGRRTLHVKRLVIKDEVKQINQETGNTLKFLVKTGVRVLGL